MAVLTGDAANNLLVGTNEDDTITGLAGNDTLNGLAGNDLLDGGDDNDTYLFASGLGKDTILDAGGTDTLDFSAVTQNESRHRPSQYQ